MRPPGSPIKPFREFGVGKGSFGEAMCISNCRRGVPPLEPFNHHLGRHRGGGKHVKFLLKHLWFIEFLIVRIDFF